MEKVISGVKSPAIGVIFPIYNEEGALPEFFRAVSDTSA